MGSVRALKAGLEGRLHCAVRLSYPVLRAQAALFQVFAICIFLGYPSRMLLGLLHKHSFLFPLVYSGDIVRTVKDGVSLSGPRGTLVMIEATLNRQ